MWHHGMVHHAMLHYHSAVLHDHIAVLLKHSAVLLKHLAVLHGDGRIAFDGRLISGSIRRSQGREGDSGNQRRDDKKSGNHFHWGFSCVKYTAFRRMYDKIIPAKKPLETRRLAEEAKAAL
jgi:hypothetical protein